MTDCRCMDEALYGVCWCNNHEPDCECWSCEEEAKLLHAEDKYDEMRDNRDFGEEV